jgi:hypothetical protein
LKHASSRLVVALFAVTIPRFLFFFLMSFVQHLKHALTPFTSINLHTKASRARNEQMRHAAAEVEQKLWQHEAS